MKQKFENKIKKSEEDTMGKILSNDCDEIVLQKSPLGNNGKKICPE
jgi:hypothetical protein